jgi:hypothetical protein
MQQIQTAHGYEFDHMLDTFVRTRVEGLDAVPSPERPKMLTSDRHGHKAAIVLAVRKVRA